VALPLKQRMIACSTSAKRKDKDSHQYDLEPPLKRQMGRVEDYLHRISMYIGNLQKRPIGSKVARLECPYQRRDEVTPPHPSIVVSLNGDSPRWKRSKGIVKKTGAKRMMKRYTLAHITHGRFYCNHRYAAATGPLRREDEKGAQRKMSDPLDAITQLVTAMNARVWNRPWPFLSRVRHSS